MSIKCLNRVWDSQHQSGSKLVLLLALADRADDDGFCWPGVASLAQRVRVSERQVQRMLRELEDEGDIYVHIGRGRKNTNQYIVLTGMDAPEIQMALIERLGLSPEEVADVIEKVTSASPFQDTEKVTSRAEKVTSRAEKVTSRAEKGDIAMSPEPSENHHRTTKRTTTASREPPGPEEPVPKAKALRDVQNEARLALEIHFAETSHIARPEPANEKQKRAVGESWWGPLRQILVLVNWDVNKAKGLIDQALAVLDERTITVSCPRSLYNTIVSIHARNGRGGGIGGQNRKIDDGGITSTATRSRLEQLRRERQAKSA